MLKLTTASRGDGLEKGVEPRALQQSDPQLQPELNLVL